jgi:predicted DNA-binding protein
MTKANTNDIDARLTIRIDPEYREAVADAARERGINQSILVRNAIQEYIERNERYFSPELFSWFRRWRQNRKRLNMM